MPCFAQIFIDCPVWYKGTEKYFLTYKTAANGKSQKNICRTDPERCEFIWESGSFCGKRH